MQKPLYPVIPPNRLNLGFAPPVIASQDASLIVSHQQSGRFAVTVNNSELADISRDEALALAAWIIHRAEQK